MLVRPKKAAPAQKGQTEKREASAYIFAAPIRGLVLTGSPVTPAEMSARLLDNWICTTEGIVPRGGAIKHATLDGGAESLFTYSSGSSEVLFASTDTDIYDITSPADADTPEIPVVSGLTDGYFSVQQFGTDAGNYLLAVNGSDYGQIFNGSDWYPITTVAVNKLSYNTLVTDFAIDETVTGGTSGATATIVGITKTSATAGKLRLGTITGGPFQIGETLTSASGEATAATASGSLTGSVAVTGVSTKDLSAVWSHNNRLWFVEENTTSAWYLSVDAIGGTATEFPLAGVFRRGGSLYFGATWSMDAGDGLDDKCLFVSTEGEVAVYSGTDPSSISTWALQGVYDMPRPLGKNAFVRAGGDVLIATETGLMPVAAAVQQDVAAQTGVSQPIAPLWQRQAEAVDTERWEIIKVPYRNIMVVSQPDTGDPDGSALVVNMQTGAWSRFTGWHTQCITEYNSRGYYGDADGGVHLMDSGGNDNGASYTCRYIGQFEHAGQPGAVKSVLQAKPIFRAGSEINPKVSVLVDYSEDLPVAPASPTNYSADVWDSGEWDQALWDAGTSYTVTGSWQSVGATGTVFAPAVQMTFGVTPTPAVEFTSVTMQFTAGAQVA